MTEKLYYSDSHLHEFEAVVTDITDNADGRFIVLDKTAFFPEGGGQKADEGHIEGFFVSDVFEKGGVIYHRCDNAVGLTPGSKVSCKLDFALRFARMQAHTGEHIVSGVAHNLFGVSNVGFHFDGLVMTVDFDKPLTAEQIAQIELSANECVYSCCSVTARILEKDELDKTDFRSKIDFPGPARIVEIEGVDKCACCAPHVSSTGEIGLIKILSCISHRGGVRLTVICGVEAYRDYCSKYRQTLNIAAMLCAKHSETDIAVDKLLQTNQSLRNTIAEMKQKHLRIIANSVKKAPLICQAVSELKGDELRELCNLLSDKAEIAVVILSETAENCYSYCIYSDVLDLRMLVKDFNSAFNGSGGGRGTVVQGKVNTCFDAVKQFFEELKVEDYANA